MNKDVSIYYGNSMHSVFTPGDTLNLARVPYESLGVGDIIVVRATAQPYVHRIIKRTGDTIITQGDDNREPDPLLITPETNIELVTGAVSFHGKPYVVNRGARGMREFRRHQMKRRLCSWLFPRLKHVERWAFWRLPARRIVHFKGEKWVYFGKIPVARIRNGNISYFSKFRRLFFRVSVESLH